LFEQWIVAEEEKNRRKFEAVCGRLDAMHTAHCFVELFKLANVDDFVDLYSQWIKAKPQLSTTVRRKFQNKAVKN
jgi:hypothetical protein